MVSHELLKPLKQDPSVFSIRILDLISMALALPS